MSPAQKKKQLDGAVHAAQPGLQLGLVVEFLELILF